MADTLDLQDAMRQVEADIARMRKLIDEQATAEAADAMELSLPAEIRVPRPAIVAAYLGKHPDMVSIITDLGLALVHEFEHDPAQIELDQYDDPEIDDHYLTFMVRMPTYDDAFLDRLKKISRPFDDALTTASGWVLTMSDFRPVAVS